MDVRQRDFGGTSGSRGLTPGRIVAVATNARQTAEQGRLGLDGENRAENIHSRVKIEGVSSARFSNPTPWHRRILMSITYLSISLTNNLNSQSNACCIDYYLKYRQDQ